MNKNSRNSFRKPDACKINLKRKTLPEIQACGERKLSLNPAGSCSGCPAACLRAVSLIRLCQERGAKTASSIDPMQGVVGFKVVVGVGFEPTVSIT